MRILKNRFLIPSIFLVLYTLAFYCYRNGLQGSFVFDDVSNILQNKSLGKDSLISVLFSGNSGPLKRPISYLSFHLNILVSGYHPYFFKLTNLIIHFVNSFLVFVISRILFSKILPDQNRQIKLAVFTASIFLFHPLALTSILYVVQRMASLSALFTFLGIYYFLIYREQINSNGDGFIPLIGSTSLFTILAVLSKENGILLPYYCVIIEIIFFRWENFPPFQKRIVKWVGTLMIFAPLLYILIKFIHQPEWLYHKPANRPFNAYERLLTEARVIWFYLRLIILPDIRLMGLYHDDIPLSKNFFTPPTTLLAVIGILFLIVSAVGFKKRAPLFSFGVLFFLIGHSLESSVILLETAHEHRNYLPMFGIMIVIVYYIDKLSLLTRKPALNHVLFVVLIGSLAYSTAIRAFHWGNIIDQSLMDANNHPNSTRSNIQAGRIYLQMAEKKLSDIKQANAQGIKHLKRAYELDPNNPSILLSLIHGIYLTGQTPTHRQYKELYRILATQPLPNMLYHTLANFTKCALAGKCTPTDEEINTIFNQILYRKNGGPTNKATTLSIASNYYAQKKEYVTAIRYLYYILDYKDDYKTRIALCDSLINLRLFDEAQDQIDILKTRSDIFLYEQKLSDLEQKLKNSRINHVDNS